MSIKKGDEYHAGGNAAEVPNDNSEPLWKLLGAYEDLLSPEGSFFHSLAHRVMMTTPTLRR